MKAARTKTKTPGIFRLEDDDGEVSYLATWRVEQTPSATDPLARRHRTVERRAKTYEEAVRLTNRGEAAERERHPGEEKGLVGRLAERMMAMKYFEYRFRR